MNIRLVRPHPNHVRIITISTAVAIIAFACGLLSVYWVPALQNLQPKETEKVVAGPSASWATLLSIAEREAIKKDSASLPAPSVIYAIPAGTLEDKFNWTYTGTLALTFAFDRPVGDVRIRMQDAAPTSTLKIEEYESSIDNPFYFQYAKGHQAQIADSISRIKLSPREALARTAASLEKYTLQKTITSLQTSPHVRLCELDSGPPNWSVWYEIREGDKNYYNYYNDVYFLVNTQTGAVSEQQCTNTNITPTP